MIERINWWRAAAWLLGCGLAGAAQAASVGMVLDARQARLADAQGRQEALDIATPLEPGQRIVLPAGGEVSLVFYPTRELLSASGPGTVVIEAGQARASAGARLQARKLPQDTVAGASGYNPRVTPAALVMKNVLGTPPLAIVSPREGEVVLEQTPELLWQGGAPGQAVRVRLLDGASLLLETHAGDGRLRVPALLALARGRAYRWELQAQDGRERAVSFTLASAQEQQRLDGLRPAADAPAAEWALYAAAAEAAHCHAEARAAWQQVARLRPESARARELAQP